MRRQLRRSTMQKCIEMETIAPVRVQPRRPVRGDNTSLYKPRRSSDRSNPVFLQNSSGVGFRPRQLADECLAIGQLVGGAAGADWAQFGNRHTSRFDHISLALDDVLDQRAGFQMQV